MEDILVAIIKFLGNFIEDIINGKKALLKGVIILLICIIILYILTKDF